MLELARALHARGKRLIAYLPAEVAGLEPALRDAFGWNPKNHALFQDRYLEFVRAYSVKYGAMCDGWWLDGYWAGIPGYDHARWIAACRAGNPAAIVAPSDAGFCSGGRFKPVTPLQDFMAGEVHLLEDGKIRTDFMSGKTYFTPAGHLRREGQEVVTYYLPASRYLEGVQWHALVPVDSTFNPAVPVRACIYSDEELQGFVKACKSVGGAVTLNLPLDRSNGHIREAAAAKMARLGKALREH